MKKINSTKGRVYALSMMYVVLLLFLAETNPVNLPAILLIAPLLWLFVCLTTTILVISSALKFDIGSGSLYRRVAYAALIAVVPTGLLLLQSIDQLSVKDILLCSLFASVALVYVRRFHLNQKIE